MSASAKKARLKLQIVSDLHLEFRHNDLDFIVPSAPILCLLGDICVIGTDDFEIYKRFIDIIYDKFAIILHVPGNHEYYTDSEWTIDKINARLRGFAQTRPKLNILINGMARMRLGKELYYIVGSTLWTHIDEKDHAYIQSQMNDYSCIRMPVAARPASAPRPTSALTARPRPSRPFTVADMQKLHKKCVASIKRYIAMATQDGAKCVLLTHHKAFHEKKYHLHQAYESDLACLFADPVIAVAYGHTHRRFNGLVNKIHTVSNPRGYPGERTMFDPQFTISL